MLLIIFFGLVATLTSGSGDCSFGTQDMNGFDFSRAGDGALAWFVEQTADNVSAWFDISFVVLLTNLNRSDQMEYVRIIEWFMNKYLLMIWREFPVF